MKNSQSVICIILCMALHSSLLYAQKDITNQSLLWSRYSLQLNINKQYKINQEIEERSYWFPWRQHQFISRTIVQRTLGKSWNIGIGFSYFLQSLPHDPSIALIENRVELRPQLELANKQELNTKVVLHHRYWSEFRIFEEANSSFEYGNVRIRYKLELRYSPMPKITLKVFDEIHFNLGKHIVQNVFDQNRYGASIQYMPIQHLGLELGYFNWFQQRSTGKDFFNRHIVRFTIHHIIKFKNAKN